MVHGVSVLLMDVMMVRTLMDSVTNTVPAGSALGNGAPRPLLFEEGVASTFTPKKSAMWTVVKQLFKYVGFAPNMVLTERASLMVAPPTQQLDLNIASNTVVGRRHRALWRVAPPPLLVKGSAPNTAAVKLNAGSQAAQTRWSAGSRPAERTVGWGTAHSQIAGLQHTRKMATAGSTPRSRQSIITIQLTLYSFN